jgi:hypothetical protein
LIAGAHVADANTTHDDAFAGGGAIGVAQRRAHAKESDRSRQPRFPAGPRLWIAAAGAALDLQVVHVGFSENLAEVLTKEIEDLLAGKDLAGPELKKAEEARKKRDESKKKAASASKPPKEEAKPADN